MSEEANRLTDISKAYEEGKHRRYNLLFAVNGGAFAVAQLLSPTSGEKGSVVKIPTPLGLRELPRLFTNPEKVSTPVLGNLNLGLLSLGMTLFTIVMVLDIFVFGQKKHYENSELFVWQGKAVLISIGLLICAGWTLVSFSPSVSPSVFLAVVFVYVGLILLVYLEMWYRRSMWYRRWRAWYRCWRARQEAKKQSQNQNHDEKDRFPGGS